MLDKFRYENCIRESSPIVGGLLGIYTLQFLACSERYWSRCLGWIPLMGGEMPVCPRWVSKWGCLMLSLINTIQALLNVMEEALLNVMRASLNTRGASSLGPV